MTGSYKRFDQINPSLFDSLIRRSRIDDQPEGTDFTPTGLMAPQTGFRQTSITPEQQTETTSDSILTRAASAIGAFSTDPDLVASTVVPQPRIPQEVDLSEWESMPPVRDFIGPSQTEQAIPTLPSSMGITAPAMSQVTADEYIPATLVLADQPTTTEAPDIIRVAEDQYNDYTTTTSAGSRNISDVQGILFHYVHGPNPEGSSLSSYMNSGFYGWSEERGSYRNGPGEGKGAPFYIARDGTIYEVGDWRNNRIQHVSSAVNRVVPDAPRTSTGERFNNENSIGIEIDVGWNYNDPTQHGQYGSQYAGEAGRPTEAQIEALNRLTHYLMNEVNASREGNPLTIENSVFAHPELQRDKMPVEGMYALERVREMAGLVPRRAGETGVFVSPVPQPRPTSEGSSKQTTEKGEAGKQTTAKDEQFSMPSNILFDFIEEQEGNRNSMYIPTESDGSIVGRSGPTIGVGVDIGQRSIRDLRGLPQSLIDKLSPYTNMRGQEAFNYVNANPLTLSQEELRTINTWAKQQETERLIDSWERDSDILWSSLTPQQATVVASVMYQYGSNLNPETGQMRAPRFWAAATSGNWAEVERELRNFGDETPSRRLREADLLTGN
jgi:hypothetical protein